MVGLSTRMRLEQKMGTDQFCITSDKFSRCAFADQCNNSLNYFAYLNRRIDVK